MAQSSDTSIDSGLSGTAFRTAVNENLAALFTSNSGVSAPGTTFGGMLWLDTSLGTPVLKVRNSANTAWNAVVTADYATATGNALLTAADAAAARTTLGATTVGAALLTAADAAAARTTLGATTVGAALMTAADAAAARTTLGVGFTLTSGTTVSCVYQSGLKVFSGLLTNCAPGATTLTFPVAFTVGYGVSLLAKDFENIVTCTLAGTVSLSLVVFRHDGDGNRDIRYLAIGV